MTPAALLETLVIIGWALLALLGLAGSALCSGSESAMYWVSRIRLEVRSANPADKAAATLRREMAKPDRMLTTLLIANNAFNYVGVLGVTALLARAGLGEIEQIIANVLIVTPLLLVAAESTPKELFRVRAETLGYAWAPFIRTLRLALTATLILPLVTACSRLVSKIARAPAPEAAIDARRRIAMHLRESSSQGVISESQAALVERALNLRHTAVRDEMTPWPRVASVGLDWPMARVRSVVFRRPYSSYPVVDRGGKVVGVLWKLDLRLRPQTALKDLMQSPARLSPSTPVLDAVESVSASKSHLGIVEHAGRPLGLVTIKDLAEPMTGSL